MGQRDFVRIRAEARARGDWNLVRAMDVELERLGHRDPEPEPLETTSVVLPEKAVVKKAGRPPRPRCEHGKLIGRCLDCDDDFAA